MFLPSVGDLGGDGDRTGVRGRGGDGTLQMHDEGDGREAMW